MGIAHLKTLAQTLHLINCLSAKLLENSNAGMLSTFNYNKILVLKGKII